MINTFRGLITHRLYEQDGPPAAQESLVVINGEPCIEVNRDGAIRRGVVGMAPANDIYAPGAVMSAWEQYRG